MSAVTLSSLPSFSDLPGGPQSCMVQQAYQTAVVNAPQDQVFCSGDLIGYLGPSEPRNTVVWSPVAPIPQPLPIVSYGWTPVVQVPPYHHHHPSVVPEPGMGFVIFAAMVAVLIFRKRSC